MARMASHKYRPFPQLSLRDRAWPDHSIQSPPRWCSVDLRDGNQALVEPMNPARKRRLFEELIRIGFKEIEVGFPAASQLDFAFVRELIESDCVPADVTLQVLTPARRDLIERTFDALCGARRVIVHLYNSTSEQQRRVVFGRDRAGIIDIAVRGAERVRDRAARLRDSRVDYEYSPESFSGTELDFALEICEAVARVWEPTVARKMIVNLPATVELSTPNLYADQIEFMSCNLWHRDACILSVHPHNDRGTAVAAAELALMAGAERVEGTLFGNGERTGNVDVCTLALNLLTQGVEPGLDFSDMDRSVRIVEEANRMAVHPRHPYAGELVFTAFSGSHQDAIKKGLAARASQTGSRWDVPYLPLDPADVGRTYREVIRVNSQSGKGGVSYLLEREAGLDLPRGLQIEFAAIVQRLADASGEEVSGEQLWAAFQGEYLATDFPLALLRVSFEGVSGRAGECELEAELAVAGERVTVRGRGNGPLSALARALWRELGFELEVRGYSEHALGSGDAASAVAYIELRSPRGETAIGVGIDPNLATASLRALVSGVNRALRLGLAALAVESEPDPAPQRL